MKRICLLLLVVVGALLGTLAAAVAAPAAPTPIVGGSDFPSAVVVSSGVEYIATVSTTHTADYFYLDVSAGQIATVQFTSTTTWSGSVLFYLFDQAHVSQLRYTAVNGASQANQWVYMGNNTTPTRYYFRATNSSGRNQYLFRITITNQTDGGLTGDAGDTAGTATLLSPAASGITSYSNNHLGKADLQDWYRINAASGQLISITVSIPDWGGATSLLLYLFDQTGTTQLAYKAVNSPAPVADMLIWASNNTTPSAYILKVQTTGDNTDKLLTYKFDVQLGQQSDGGTPGDAGDDFASARTVALTSGAPVLNAQGNMLAGSDKDDYFLIKLPPVPPLQSPASYNFYLNVTSWPAVSAFIRLYAYDHQQNPLNNLGKIINTPSTTVFAEDITACGSDGCYFRLQTGYSGYNPIVYTIAAKPVYYIYVPLVIR